MARKDEEGNLVYYIPKNFEEKSLTMSGLSYKNIAEAAVIAGIIAAILWFIPIELKTKCIMGAIIGIPLCGLAVFGINDCSLSEFLINFVKYKINAKTFIKKELFKK